MHGCRPERLISCYNRLGFPEMEGPAAVGLVQGHGASVISVDYRLAPEHVFPKPIEDGWDALKWVCERSSSLTCRGKID